MQPLEKSMEMGWAVCCASWGGEAPWKCCSSHHRQERGESCSWLLQQQGDVVSHCFSLLYLRKWLQSKETSLPHFLAAFNEGMKHKWVRQPLSQCHVALGSTGGTGGTGLPRSPGCVGRVSPWLHPGVKQTALCSQWSGMPGQWSCNLLFFTQQTPYEETTWARLGCK